MRRTKKISEVFETHPFFKDKIEWGKIDQDNVFCHKDFGSIIHSIVCSESGEPIYDLPIFDFTENSVIIPYFKDENGKISKVFMIECERPSCNLNLMEFPGGNIEKLETPKQAAIRELKEETTLSILEEPIFLGRLILNHACSKKPETYIWAVRVGKTNRLNKYEEIRESKIISQKEFSIDEVDTMFSLAKDYSSTILAAWTLFKLQFKEKF